MSVPGNDQVNAYRNFIDELKRLHFYGGRPTPRELRALAKEKDSKVSQAAIAEALRWPRSPVREAIATSSLSERLPRWEVTEILVRVLNGDLRHFRMLWEAARAQITSELGANWQSVSSVGQSDGADTGFTPAPSSPPRVGVDFPSKPGSDIQTRGPWGRLDYDEYSSPTAIRLMEAAVRDGRDAADLLVKISCADPHGAAPALAMVAEHNLAWAAEIVAQVQDESPAGVPRLLMEVTNWSHRQAAALTKSLLDKPETDPSALFETTVRLAGKASEHWALAALTLAKVGTQGRINFATDVLVRLVNEDASLIPPVAGMLELILAEDGARGLGLQTLGWLAKADAIAAAEIFLQLISGSLGEGGRRTKYNEMVLAIIATHYPSGCAFLFLTCATRGKGAVHHSAANAERLGGLVLELSSEAPIPAGTVVSRMIRQGPRAVMSILGSVPQGKTDMMAKLLVAVGKAEPALAASVLSRWINTTYPAYSIPAGWLVEQMVQADTATGTSVLAHAAAEFVKPVALAGLDQRSRRKLAATIRVHANSEQWNLIKRFL